MTKKLKINMILIELIFLLIVVGGSAVMYSVFAPWYYSSQKSAVIKEAFEEVKRMDMTNLTEDDYEAIKSYEADNLTFTICDENFTPIYTTRKGNEQGQIHRNIKVNLGSFSKRPEVKLKSNRGVETIRLLGRYKQDNVKYYMCVKENVKRVYSTFLYTERFLVFVIVVCLIVGSLVMYWQSRRIAKPIEDIAQISKQIAEHDFSARVKTYHNYQEIHSLTVNFNEMADQLQYYVEKLEHGNDMLTQDNEQLLEENLKRERLDKMRQTFMANVSHELKTPLAVISSQMELMQAMGDKVDRDYYFESIREEVQKMSDMVGNLLDVSALEHKLETMEKESMNLSEVVEYMGLRYEALFRQKELKVKLEAEPDCVVEADRKYIEQALNNYIMNAFQHVGSGRNMEITLRREAQEVKVSVYNEGKEIPESELERIWDSYYQAERLRDHTGLGLYIVKTIISTHGGRYGVENGRGGVTFWFTLPV